MRKKEIHYIAPFAEVTRDGDPYVFCNRQFEHQLQIQFSKIPKYWYTNTGLQLLKSKKPPPKTVFVTTDYRYITCKQCLKRLKKIHYWDLYIRRA